jgi:uncharacterized membrane protein
VIPMMDWGHMDAGSAVTALAWVVGLLLVGGAVVAIVAVLHLARRGEHASHKERPSQRSSAENELELRYARGEIDAATFVQQRTVLRQG